MTDDRVQEQPTGAAVEGEVDETGATVVGAIGDEAGVQAAGAIVTDYEYAAIVAAFDDEAAAKAAYENLRQAETRGVVAVEGVLVIKTDEKGIVQIQEMTDHSTRTGVKWGVVGGVVLGILFPPSVLAGAVGAGVIGGVLGKIRNVKHKSEVSDVLAGALGPNESGILALVAATDVQAVTADMPEATSVRSAGVDGATAQQITAAARQVDAS